MKFLLLAFILAHTAEASFQEWVTVEVKVKSHHGSDETMKLKMQKDGKLVKLIVDDFVLPETRILTNKADLDAIVNFPAKTEGPCEAGQFSYVKRVGKNKTEVSGCPTNLSFQKLRKSFQNISAISN